MRGQAQDLPLQPFFGIELPKYFINLHLTSPCFDTELTLMTKLFRGFVLLLAGMFVVSILTGCGGGDDIVIDDSVPANFVSATPPGGKIATNSRITINFDNTPFDVTVSAGTVTVVGKTATIAGPFPPGPLALTITWADGTQALNYTITGPD